jgi:two-component system, OmpR family, sensor kinase
MTPVHIPIRARITAAFAAVMLVLLAAVAVLAYRSMSAALLDEIDSGLRFRASAVARTAVATATETPDPRLQEPRESFEQFLGPDGRLVRGTAGFGRPLLGSRELSDLSRPRFFVREVPGVAGTARLLAVPLTSSTRAQVLVVGTSMSDRTDALRDLERVLLVGGSVAIAFACLSAWTVAGWALKPMDRMRREAAAITASGPDRRMPVPRTRDELQRLAVTLNKMLDRLAAAIATERAFLERAGHELRTPLAALRAEIDLALRTGRSQEDLASALRSVSEEADRLARLAEDLLVLARANDGRLPLHKQPVSLAATLESAAALFTGRTQERGIALVASGPDLVFAADPLRVRQALLNLLDNALRHTPPGGTIRLTGWTTGADVCIQVADDGPGFADPDPDPDSDSDRDRAGSSTATAGLGLQIVRAVVVSHGGTMRIGSSGAGATVDLRFPHSIDREAASPK